MDRDRSQPPDASADESTDDAGGDAVCWLERVCSTCGGLSDGPTPPVCHRCGTPRA